jgi:hypothetical protein
MSNLQDEVPGLKLPDWLPPVVKFAAQKICLRHARDNTSDDIELLNRLISDHRMRKVWDELNHNMTHLNANMKFAGPWYFYYCRLGREKLKIATELRTRGGDENEARARILELQATDLVWEPTNEPDQWPETYLAIYCFFYGLYTISMDPKPLPSQEFLTEMRVKYLAAKQQLMSLSRLLSSFDMQSEAEQLARIADTMKYRDVGTRYVAVGTRIVKRVRSDPVLQSFLVRLSTISRFVFKRPLYGTLATTANVALNLHQPINRQQARAILRSFTDTWVDGGFIIPSDPSWPPTKPSDL